MFPSLLMMTVAGTITLYIMFQISEFVNGKQKAGMLFFIFIMYTGAIVSQISFENNWQIAEMISVWRVIKIVYLSTTFLVGGIFIRGGVIRTILTIAISDVLGGMVELFEQVLYFYVVHHSMEGFYMAEIGENSLLQSLLLAGCSTIFCVFMRNVFRKIRKIAFEEQKIAKLFAFAYIVVVFVPYIGGIVEQSGDRKEFLFFCIALGCVFLGVTVLLFREKNRIFQQKNLYLFLQEQMMKEHVRLMEDQIAITRKFRHDIRKHLDMVSYFVKQNPKYETSQQLEEYKSDLCEMYQSLSQGITVIYRM